MSFETFGLAQPLLRAVAAEGYTQPTPIQTEAIPHVFFENMKSFTQRELTSFKTREEALDWLVED